MDAAAFLIAASAADGFPTGCAGPCPTARHLFVLFAGKRLAEAHSRPSPIVVDELYAGGLQSALNYVECRSSWLVGACFKLPNRNNSDACFLRQVAFTSNRVEHAQLCIVLK